MKPVFGLAVVLLFAAAPAFAGVYEYQKRHDDIMSDLENANSMLSTANYRAQAGDRYGSCDAFSTGVSSYYAAYEAMKDLAYDVSLESDDVQDAFGDLYDEASQIEDMADGTQSDYDYACTSSDSYDSSDYDSDDSDYETDEDDDEPQWDYNYGQ